jgi:hypothetical protein
VQKPAGSGLLLARWYEDHSVVTGLEFEEELRWIVAVFGRELVEGAGADDEQ